MTSRAVGDRRYRPDQAGDDLVRILTNLTRDVERFDSVILRQRRLLEDLAGHVNDLDTNELQIHSERIRLEAAEMVACAREALDRLSRLAESTAPHRLPESAGGRLGRLQQESRLD